VLDFLPLEAGAFYVMDRGYLDFARLYLLHQARAFFVTRAKRGMDARRVYSSVTDRATGVMCDQRIALNGFYVAKDYPEHLRRIRFKDPDSGKTLVFLTNNLLLPPLTIAALYKSRWQVELFFDVATQCTSAYVIEHQGGAAQHWLCGPVRNVRG
jgi:IS4 transposase